MRRQNKELRESVEYAGYVSWKDELKDESQWEAIRLKDQAEKPKK